jgi:ATP-dependent Clp protease ATP-binding subunit ClpC
MFAPFTENARRSIVVASSEALKSGASEVGMEHLVLGIVSEGKNIASEVLKVEKLDTDAIRAAIGSGHAAEPRTTEILLSEDAKRAIELAFTEAVESKRARISTEELLLGVLKRCESMPASGVAKLFRDRKKIESELRRRIAAENV